MDNVTFHTLTEMHVQREDRIEIPCKDMDLDCLPDENGGIPFGNYTMCYAYDPEKGMCPFTPFRKGS